MSVTPSDIQEELVALARSFAEKEIRPVAAHYDETEETPWEPGAASRWWLHQSLEKLAATLEKMGAPLVIRRGPSLEALRGLAAEFSATHVVWNRRYEPALIRRDTAIKKALADDGLLAESFNGSLLF